MNYKGLAEISGLPQKTIKHLEKRGIVTEPLNEEQIFFMQQLHRIWGDEELIRQQLSTLSEPRKAKVVFGAGYNKWQRWIVSRLLKHFNEREQSKFNLHLEQVVDECMHYHKLPKSMHPIVNNCAHKIRRKINNMRYRNMELKDISERIIEGKKPKRKTVTPTRSLFNQVGQNEIFGYN